jgi:hypothetical protein
MRVRETRAASGYDARSEYEKERKKEEGERTAAFMAACKGRDPGGGGRDTGGGAGGGQKSEREREGHGNGRRGDEAGCGGKYKDRHDQDKNPKERDSLPDRNGDGKAGEKHAQGTDLKRGKHQ